MNKQNAKFFINTDGHLCVRNLSALWLPEFTLQKEIGGTLYSVSGIYTGTETLDRKLKRIMEQTASSMEGHQ